LHCAAHGLQSCGEGRHRAHKQHTHHWCRPLEGSIGSACGTMMSATLSARALRRVRGVLVAAFVCVSAIQTTVFVSRTHAAHSMHSQLTLHAAPQPCTSLVQHWPAFWQSQLLTLRPSSFLIQPTVGLYMGLWRGQVTPKDILACPPSKSARTDTLTACAPTLAPAHCVVMVAILLRDHTFALSSPCSHHLARMHVTLRASVVAHVPASCIPICNCSACSSVLQC
jgi:hypothetical protein